MRVTTILILLLAPLCASAESIRCGKWVVNEESSPADIAAKCGEPQDKEIQKSDVFGRNAAGYTFKTGVQVTERWYYKLSTGSLPMLVTIVDGKVKSIERISE